jgi:hypothetical protein
MSHLFNLDLEKATFHTLKQFVKYLCFLSFTWPLIGAYNNVEHSATDRTVW